MRKAFALALTLLAAPAIGDANAQGSDRAGLEAFLSRYVHSRGEAGGETRYAAAFADLSGDRRQEAIVYLSGSFWCGSGGCTTLVLARRGLSWRRISYIAITRLPIRVLRTRHNGWRDLGVVVAGGGIMTPYEAALRFNGAYYADNPTIPPAKRVSGARGRILIAEDARERPLK